MKQYISSRANYRGQINKVHADISNFGNKTISEKEALTSKLKRLQNELDKLDPLIKDLKWESNSVDEILRTLKITKKLKRAQFIRIK